MHPCLALLPIRNHSLSLSYPKGSFLSTMQLMHCVQHITTRETMKCIGWFTLQGYRFEDQMKMKGEQQPCINFTGEEQDNIHATNKYCPSGN